MGDGRRQFEFIDHTADIIVRAYGASMADAFAASADALFAIITDSASPAGQNKMQRTVRSIDREGLLVAFLSELIAIHEIDNVVLSDFEVTIESDTELTFAARSEPFELSRHGEGTPVKGISYHLMEIGIDPVRQCPYVQVLFDI